MNSEEKNNFLNDFSNWVQSKDLFKHSFERINKKVYPKSIKYSNKISLDFGNLLEVKKDFVKNGGKVLKEEDGSDMVLIEVKSGTFYIKKSYIH